MLFHYPSDNENIGKLITTKYLTKEFDWNDDDVKTNHDAEEMLRVVVKCFDFGKLKILSKYFKHEMSGKVKGIDKYKLYEAPLRSEKYTVIPLTVNSYNTDLYRALNCFIRPNKIEKDTEEYGRIDVNKYIKIDDLGPILVFYLKRMGYDKKTNKMFKKLDLMEYYENINMNGFVSDDNSKISWCKFNEEYYHTKPDGPYHYTLVGALCSIGTSLQNGHYISYLSPDGGNNWNLYNDTNVTEVDSTYWLLSTFGGENSIKSRMYCYLLVYIQNNKKAKFYTFDTNKIKQLNDYFNNLKNNRIKLLNTELLEESKIKIYFIKGNDNLDNNNIDFIILKSFKTCKILPDNTLYEIVNNILPNKTGICGFSMLQYNIIILILYRITIKKYNCLYYCKTTRNS